MRTGLAVITVAGALLLLGPASDLRGQSAGGERTEDTPVTKRDLRAAREALEAGRWEEAATGFERILASRLARDPAVRSEALFATALVLLSDPHHPGSLESAADKLAALQGSARGDAALELEAIGGLVAALLEARQEISTLSSTALDRQQEHDAEIATLLEQLHSRASTIERLRRRVGNLRSTVDERETHVRELLAVVAARERELAENQADIEFLTSQLEGSHEDQTKMLAAVMKKNETLKEKERQLAALRTELDRQQQELDDQGDVLRAKEEELRKREEAIREVTDRILKKEQPDS